MKQKEKSIENRIWGKIKRKKKWSAFQVAVEIKAKQCLVRSRELYNRNEHKVELSRKLKIEKRIVI